MAYITKAGSTNCPPCHEEPMDDTQEEATLQAFSAYDLTSLKALILYFHAADGYPVRDMCLKAMKASNYE